MYRRFFLSIVLAIATAIPGFAIDASLLPLLPPDAKAVVGMDFSRVMTSPFGQFVLRQMNLNSQEIDRMGAMVGFDPRRDLHEAILALMDPQSRDALVLLRGVFDVERIYGFANLQGANTTTYKGVRIMGAPGRPRAGRPSSVAFLSPNLMALGMESSVKSVIDRQSGGANPDESLVARIQAAGSRYDMWFLTNGSVSSLAGLSGNPNVSGAMGGNVLQALESLLAGFKFGDTVEISAEAMARTEKDATALVDVIRFFGQMAQSNASASASALFEALKLTTDGRVVRASISVPNQEFEKIISSGPGPSRRL